MTPLRERSISESTSGAYQRNNEAAAYQKSNKVAAWLGRIDNDGQRLSARSFNYGDSDAASENDDDEEDGENKQDGRDKQDKQDESAMGEGFAGTVHNNALDEGYTIAQLAELHISQQKGKKRDRASEGFVAGSSEEGLNSAENFRIS